MKKKLTTFAFLAALFLSVNSLFADEQQRTVGSFSGISLKISGNIHLKQGDNQSIRIVAKTSTLEEIITEVKDGNLVFRFENENHFFNSFNPGDIEIYVTNPQIELLSISGSGDIIAESGISSKAMNLAISGSGTINIEELSAENIKASISGSGDIILGGKKTAIDLGVGISGSGGVKAINLPVENVKIKVSGSGDCSVFAEKTLIVNVSGSGDVVYKGKPQTDTNVSGSGKVKSIN